MGQMNRQEQDNEITPRLPEILDRSLEVVLSRRGTIDSCCRKYPDAAAELRPLLTTAVRAGEALSVEAPQESMVAARKTIMAVAGRPGGAGKETSMGLLRTGGRRYLLRPATIAAVLLVLLFAGTAAASTGAGPDSVLYPLKQRLEDARRLAAVQDLDQAEVEVGRAESRLDETLEIMDKEKPEYVPELMSRFDTHLEAASSLVVEAAEKGDDANEVEEMIEVVRERRRQILGEIDERLPDDVREAVRKGQEEERGETGSDSPVSAPAPGPQPAGGGYAVPDDSDGYEPGRGGDNDGGYEDSPGPGPAYEPPEYHDYEPPEKEGGDDDSFDGEHSSNSSIPYPAAAADDD